MLNIIGFDFRTMRENQLKCIEKDMSTLCYKQRLEVDVHLFENRENIVVSVKPNI
jgi:hypothetical protein